MVATTNIRCDRYTFNGMERDDEVKGSGNSYDFGARMYDPRLGRWLSRDPLARKFPHQSPYVAFNNNPIYFVDPDGQQGEPTPTDLYNAAAKSKIFLATGSTLKGQWVIQVAPVSGALGETDIWQSVDYGKPDVIRVDPNQSFDQAVLTLAYETKNASNAPRYRALYTSTSSFTKSEFVAEILKLEAEATIEEGLVGLELNLESELNTKFLGIIKSYKEGTIKYDAAVNRISEMLGSQKVGSQTAQEYYEDTYKDALEYELGPAKAAEKIKQDEEKEATTKKEAGKLRKDLPAPESKKKE